MPTPSARSWRSTSKRSETSREGRLALGSSSTRKSQSTASARAIATIDFSARVRRETRIVGLKWQPTRSSASPVSRSQARWSMNGPRRAKPLAIAMFSAMLIHSIRPRS